MIKDGTYHREIGMPHGFKNPFIHVPIVVVLSQHARQARQDRYGYIDLDDGDEFLIADEEIVELQFETEQPVKAGARIAWDDNNDLVVVLMPPRQGRFFVKTMWFNRASDKHRTLDRSKYVKP